MKYSKNSIDNLLRYLISILDHYAIGYNIRISHNPKSNSKYISFPIKEQHHTIRISDHNLPPMRKRHKKNFYDIRPHQFNEGKKIITDLFTKKKVNEWNVPRWGRNLKIMVNEFTAELNRQEDRNQYSRWLSFFCTLMAISVNEKRKLYQMTFPEVMQHFKLPKKTPPWIKAIFDRYC